MLIRSFNSLIFTQDGALRGISEVVFLAIFGWHTKGFMMSSTDTELTLDMGGDVKKNMYDPPLNPDPPSFTELFGFINQIKCLHRNSTK